MNAVEESVEIGVVEIVVEEVQWTFDVRVIRGLEAAVFPEADGVAEFVGICTEWVPGRECDV